MAISRLACLVLGAVCLSGLGACSSTPAVVVEVTTRPAGADVFISRRGEKSYRGKLGPVETDMPAEELQEGFALVGSAPLRYTSPLEERASGATVMGIGAEVILKYREGVVRVEKDGYEPVERTVRFHDGQVRLDVELQRRPAAPPDGGRHE